MNWNIQRAGRAWQGEEARERIYLAPEKIEMTGGKIFFSEEERIKMLGLLLENVGLDKALELCDVSLAQEAIEKIKAKKK